MTARPFAYLTQAVQSRDFSVPLVAGRKALLRVFPTLAPGSMAGLPPVRARFFLDGRETHVARVAARPAAVRSGTGEGDLAASVNAEVPAHVVQPGLEMVIELGSDGTMDRAMGEGGRIPATGALAADVRRMPDFDLTLVPFVRAGAKRRDAWIVESTKAAAADPENHELLWATRTLLPVGELRVKAHESVLTSSDDIITLNNELQLIRCLEGGGGYYAGLMSPSVSGGAGLAANGGPWCVSRPDPITLAHELGHCIGLLDLQHHDGSFDEASSYPHADGSIGCWGYDFRDGGRLVDPSTPDLMSYGHPRWIGGHNFTEAMRSQLEGRGTPDDRQLDLFAGLKGVAYTKALLLWGGIEVSFSDDGEYKRVEAVLNPAFVIDAPALLPKALHDDPDNIAGWSADGTLLFSHAFDMPHDPKGTSQFVYLLPVMSGWENLAGIALNGDVKLDHESASPMAILRNPRTRQVRGILRGTDAVAPIAGIEGLEAHFSRGIPARRRGGCRPGASRPRLGSRGIGGLR